MAQAGSESSLLSTLEPARGAGQCLTEVLSPLGLGWCHQELGTKMGNMISHKHPPAYPVLGR